MIEIAPTKSQRSAFRQSTREGRDELDPAFYGINKVEDFRKNYPACKPLTDANFFEDAFGNGRAMHNVSLITRRPVEWWYGVQSFDPRALTFTRNLVKELNARLPVDLDEDGFSKHGVFANFDKLKTVAGYTMSKMSHPVMDNSDFRSQLGLRNQFTPREMVIATEMWTLVWKSLTLRPVNTSKISVSGMRQFTYDLQYKLDFAQYLIEGKHLERMLDAVDKNDYLTLSNEFDTIFALYIQKRVQVDSVGKERFVRDLKRAIMGGEEGTYTAADKHVDLPGGDWSDFSAGRARVVQAGPWTVNCILQMISTCHMYSLFDKYPSTFHVNTEEELKAECDGYHIWASDVSEYDSTMPWPMLQCALDTCREYWDPRMVKAAERLLLAPYYSRPLELTRPGEKRKGYWVGDPRDPESKLKTGNRSGHAWTSLIAKVNKVIDTLVVCDKIFPVLGKVEMFLQGKMPIRFLNNGDDEVIIARDKRILDLFVQYRLDLNIGQYKVEAESGHGFSGRLMCRESRSSVVYTPTAKIHTAFEKWICPERSINTEHRKYPTIGMMDRITNLMRTDQGREAWSIAMSVWRTDMKPHFGDFNAVLSEQHAKINIDTSSYTSKEKELIDDPDKIHYKFKDDEIREDVLKLVTSKIPLTTVETVVSQYYKGHLN